MSLVIRLERRLDSSPASICRRASAPTAAGMFYVVDTQGESQVDVYPRRESGKLLTTINDSGYYPIGCAVGGDSGFVCRCKFLSDHGQRFR